MNTATLDNRISEFDTQQQADDYEAWLKKKIEEARVSPTVSHEEARVHFAAKRTERIVKLKNAAAS
ncbi:hypothetical protein [Neisseria chenwenguii]|uniref:Uncharacterized protein n=1 Tax=Neisseria chenwenguii TaxID=1853278 RepID=A0A220S0Z1_9NEIS|nr:hypothetical protein [Neisseria chenwenguii]ASK27160.1 hypothetical protein BG910_04880 [Neisseria chenwenguii]ROV56580.1 hypothetical protein EGS38_04170 [Neisseria chenwenguii]